MLFVAGAEGKVDESMELMKEVEDLKQKKRMAEVHVRRDILICLLLVFLSWSIIQIISYYHMPEVARGPRTKIYQLDC